MPAPPYMRFYVDAYCKDTLGLNMEEQGVYMRLLCTMWKHGGKIINDDRYIARALPIQIHKWRKVKPQLLPFLIELSPGYLTQNRLNLEYHFSSGDKKQNSSATPQVTPPVTPGVTHHVTPLVTGGVTPLVDSSGKQISNRPESKEIERSEEIPPGGVAHALARALDLSRSRLDKNNKARSLEDGDGGTWGKPDFEAQAARFIHLVITAFEKHKLHPPADYSTVNDWVANGCDPLKHILPAVEASLNRLGGSDPPRSWRYFAHEVYARKKTNREKTDG